MIDLLLGQVGRLILLVVVAVAVAQHFAAIMSLLLGVGLMLVIARILWPLPRR
jgi:uncharacterized membrane protein